MMNPSIQTLPHWVTLSQPVAEALRDGQPVVALETTILSHGLPWPTNLETGRLCEEAVRNSGAIPATLGIVGGRLIVGLDGDQIQDFCQLRHPITKVNPSNMAAVLAGGGWGSLTVAACLQVCGLVNLPVFATGGIGGVHRGWTIRPDVSADLPALGRYPVVTVCAGAKSLLDLPATLEVLETMGVPVLGWKTDCFPRFHVPTSDLSVDSRVDTPGEVAQIARRHWELARSSAGVLLTVPVPGESAMESGELEVLLNQALKQAELQGITGRKVTPFLLDWLAKNSNGKSLRANLALVVQNCGVAGQVAVALAKLS